MKRYHVFLPEDDVETLKGYIGDSLTLSAALQALLSSYVKELNAQLSASQPNHIMETDLEYLYDSRASTRIK
jgi:hypothetical protein